MSGVLAIVVLGALAGVPLHAVAEPTEYGIASVDASLSTYEAGAHPDLSVAVAVKEDPTTPPNPVGLHDSYAATRDVILDLPPGLIGNPNAVAKCTLLQLSEWKSGGGCPNDSQVGVTVIYAYALSRSFVEPVYLMEAPGNAVARLGFIAGLYPTFVDASLRPGDYGVRAAASSLNGSQRLVKAQTTLWGVPAATRHDTERQTPQEAFNGADESAPHPPNMAPAPFITNPTRCGAPLHVRGAVDSYGNPGAFSSAETLLPSIYGCDALRFEPELQVRPTSARAAEPTGLEATMNLPRNEAVEGNATSELRGATVTLPAGMSVSPGAAAGLVGCTADQVRLDEEAPSDCPDAAKIGKATFVSPALPEPLQGAIYQREPEPGHLLRIWLVADGLGLNLKLSGEIEADPETGQLTAVFADMPQLPVERISLDLRGGSKAPLSNPPRCGVHLTHYSLEPWSGTGSLNADDPMEIDEHCETGGFAPVLDAGTAKPIAGSFAPFVTELRREDGEQNVSQLEVRLPAGELAKLSGVPLCGRDLAEGGACPASSRVGSIDVAAGPGTQPLWLPQPDKLPTAVYLAGPYEGASYSLVFAVPAQAGPFDLGTVVTRAAVRIDPETAQVTAASDRLPQILQGIPISYRVIHVDIDRPEFALNPTDCEPMSVVAAVRSDAGAVAMPSSRFRVDGCRALGFKPKLALRLLGATHRGVHPGLRAVLKMPAGGANIGRASVALPPTEFLDQGHIDGICSRVQFAAEECPAGSVYGHAVARTPLLDEPLRGPVYLRSSGQGHELPDLVADLRGEIRVVLAGHIDSVNGGMRTVFASVPDAPVSRFVLTMQGGRKGLLQNTEGVCNGPQRAIVSFKGQNGRLSRGAAPVRNSCRNPGPRRSNR